MKTKIKFFIVLSLFAFACKKDSSLSKEQSDFFIKYFGNSSVNQSGDIKQTPDGGYIIIGTVSDGASTNISLIKTDAWGNKEWTRTFGGILSDLGKSVQLTPDGGYILLGTYMHSPENTDMFLIKTNASGKEIWPTSKKIGGLANQEGNCVDLTSDGGYILAGSTTLKTIRNSSGTRDIFYVKTNANGDSTWSNAIDNNWEDFASFVKQKPNNGFVITGSSEKNIGKGSDIIVIETDLSGSPICSPTFGGTNNEFGESIEILSNGNYILTGSTSSYGNGGSDIYMAEIQKSGDNLEMLWNKSFGGALDDFGKKIISTNDNGYIIIGSTKSILNDFDQYLIKTNHEGTQQWTKTYGGAGVDKGMAVVQTKDGGYAILGITQQGGNPMISLIKTKSTGELK